MHCRNRRPESTFESAQPRDQSLHVALSIPETCIGKPKAAKTQEAAGPREGSKTAQVVAMLQRKNGATLAEIMDKMGRQRHTVRRFCAPGGARGGPFVGCRSRPGWKKSEERLQWNRLGVESAVDRKPKRNLWLSCGTSKEDCE
ncbi:MAG: DUF3489 domain-containing protein [Bryobacteraceae bacterium]